MRLTAGKIYFWGGLSIVVFTVWNRYSTQHLRVIVDDMKEERMKEAERLRQYQSVNLTEEQKNQQKLVEQRLPAHFNPYYKQQQQESEASQNV